MNETCSVSETYNAHNNRRLICDGSYNNGNNKGILYGLWLLQQHQQQQASKRGDKEE